MRAGEGEARTKKGIAMKPLLSLVVVSSLVGLAGTAAAQAVPPGPKITISTVTQPLPTQPQYTRVDVPFFTQLLPERSGGRISGKVASHSEMSLGGSEIIRLVRSGQVDLGGATLTTVSGDVPILDGIDLAGLAPDIATARKIAEALRPVANKDLEKFSAKLVLTYPFPAQVFFCRRPVADLNDLKGRKIRVSGGSLTDLINAMAAQPVSIGFPEVYSALERGVVDCAVTGTGSGNAAKWPEVTTHIYDLPVGYAVAGYFVNLPWWNKLEPPVRSFLEAQFTEMEDKLWQLGAEATRDGIDCNIGKAEGCKIHTLVSGKPMTEVPATEADKAQLKKIFAAPVLPNWVKRCGARCGDVFNEVVAPIAGVKYAAQ
jgi:TRAP-type C4-dicarboxylate transport system substrate-binding protein